MTAKKIKLGLESGAALYTPDPGGVKFFFGISNDGNLVPEELNLVIGQDFWLQS